MAAIYKRPKKNSDHLPKYYLNLPDRQLIPLSQKPAEKSKCLFSASVITDHIYLGDFGDACDTEQLINNNIYYIFNMAEECRIHHPKSSNIKVYNFGIADNSDESRIKENTMKAICIMHEKIVNGNKVLVNCRAGISRSSTVVIAYLMNYEQMPYTKAFMMVKERRVNITPNFGFCLFLHKFNAKLFPDEPVSPTMQTPTSLCTFMDLTHIDPDWRKTPITPDE